MIQLCLWVAVFFRQVIHACGDYPHCSWYQFFGSAAFGAVLLHVLHRAMAAFIEPLIEPGFRFGKIDIADAELLEAEFFPPTQYVALKRCEVVCCLSRW